MKKMTKKQWLIACTVSIGLFVGGLLAWNRVNEPQAIGPNMEYVGKTNITCEWWELPMYLLGCPGPKYAYYFATDLNKTALENYLKHANYVYESETVGISYDYVNLRFELSNNAEQHFSVGYYDEKNTQLLLQTTTDPIKKTSKKHIVEITAEDYQLAKSAY